MSESDYRKSPEFLEAQERACKASGDLQAILDDIRKRWPPRNGWYWAVNEGGKIGQYRLD